MSDPKLSAVLRKKMDTVKDDYLRVVDMNKKGQASQMRVTYEQGLYDGLERAWREAVMYEHDCLLDVRLPVSELDRLQAVEQKAIALLRYIYAAGIKEEYMYSQVVELRKAVGITVEELRPDADRCECHERDGSYVCESCYKKGLRGHMQKGDG